MSAGALNCHEVPVIERIKLALRPSYPMNIKPGRAPPDIAISWLSGRSGGFVPGSITTTRRFFSGLDSPCQICYYIAYSSDIWAVPGGFLNVYPLPWRFDRDLYCRRSPVYFSQGTLSPLRTEPERVIFVEIAVFAPNLVSWSEC
jgi:hypothetical protein